jgi:F-type H+-transporting ATPase subunit epsilon
LGIFPNHAPLLAELVPGEIRFRKGGALELLAVSGGFVEVRDNRVSVFAETAEMAQEIDVERARQAAEKAKAVLRAPSADMDLEQIEAALRRALIRLRTAESLRRRSGASHT